MFLIRLPLMLCSLIVAHKAVCQCRLVEVHEDMVKALLVLQVFLSEYSKIWSVPEAFLIFFDDLLSLWLQSIQDY